MSVGGASSSTKGLLAIAKANAEINRDALDAANFVGAKATINRKRKDPSFMRSHSDLGQMALPRRKMNFDLAPANAADNPPHSPFHQRHRRQQPPDIPSAQVSASDPAVLFDMSPDMSRYPSACNNPRDDSGCASGNNDRFGAAHDKQPTAYAGGPFSLYPAPIPRPGGHLPR
ncbi:hypothetical protein EV175_006734 [Coemansia sp. RSA 1933]|nr:hypothetical protein EV175_006734 [Coemansia sp. RSA 1933]